MDREEIPDISTMTRLTLRGKVLFLVIKKQKEYKDKTGRYMTVPRAVLQILNEHPDISNLLI